MKKEGWLRKWLRWRWLALYGMGLVTGAGFIPFFSNYEWIEGIDGTVFKPFRNGIARPRSFQILADGQAYGMIPCSVTLAKNSIEARDAMYDRGWIDHTDFLYSEVDVGNEAFLRESRELYQNSLYQFRLYFRIRNSIWIVAGSDRDQVIANGRQAAETVLRGEFAHHEGRDSLFGMMIRKIREDLLRAFP